MVQGIVLIGLAVAVRPIPVVAEVKALVVAGGGVAASFALAWLLISRVPGIPRDFDVAEQFSRTKVLATDDQRRLCACDRTTSVERCRRRQPAVRMPEVDQQEMRAGVDEILHRRICARPELCRPGSLGAAVKGHVMA
jgi:hypothetical protein